MKRVYAERIYILRYIDGHFNNIVNINYLNDEIIPVTVILQNTKCWVNSIQRIWGMTSQKITIA